MPEGTLSARTKIKMSALKISNDDADNNGNGINWVKDYVNDNKDSIIGAPYKVCFVDDEKTIPSGHGNMDHDSQGNVIFGDSDTVGSIQSVSVEAVVIDGESCEVLMTEGYLYEQSYPLFVNWLREEIKDGNVYGSIEINGKAKSKKIIYENGGEDASGNPLIGRKPKVFDFTALAILSDMVEPADQKSIVVELNNKQKEGSKMPDKSVEINELTYWDLTCLISRAFNKAMNDDDRYRYFYIYALYPSSSRIIMQDDSKVPAVYYLSVYTITGNKVTLSEITEVEADWKPVGIEQAAEINTKAINLKLKESFEMTDEKLIEMNQKIDDSTKTINTLTTKNVELGDAVVNANKLVEELNLKITGLETELNTCKTERDALKGEKEATESEAKKAEINTYFTTEISKNGFSDEEINSLNHFVTEVDLTGLKSAESELCAKKFKEMLSKKVTDVETNSKQINFIAIPEKEKKIVTNEEPIFFKEV